MTCLTICDAGFHHLGYHCCTLDKNGLLDNLELEHEHTSSTVIEEGSDHEYFTKYVGRQARNTSIIWKKLGGTPTGAVGEIVYNFIQWFRDRTFSVVNLAGVGICEFPTAISKVFEGLEKLDLSSNPLRFVPGNLKVDVLDLSYTSFEELPYLPGVKKVDLTGTWTEIPEWLATQPHELEELTLDERIIAGNPPEFLPNIPAALQIRIGNLLEGPSAQIKHRWSVCQTFRQLNCANNASSSRFSSFASTGS
ncbi:MAG: hypothetical protein H7A39_01095 [Chlamydiales bacterium]|nr:hypothetical protein [Chlamydiales bacterium]